MTRSHDASDGGRLVQVPLRRLRELELDSKILDLVERECRRLSPSVRPFRDQFRELARTQRRIDHLLAEATERAEADKAARRVRIDSAAETPPPARAGAEPAREAGSPERGAPAGR